MVNRTLFLVLALSGIFVGLASLLLRLQLPEQQSITALFHASDNL